MYAPVVTRFRSYAVAVDPVSAAYCAHICSWPDLVEWVAAAQLEPEQIEELEVEFLTALIRRSWSSSPRRRTGHGPSTSSVRKSAGATTSRYSMSGE